MAFWRLQLAGEKQKKKLLRIVREAWWLMAVVHRAHFLEVAATLLVSMPPFPLSSFAARKGSSG